jgi:hypothetical protein
MIHPQFTLGLLNCRLDWPAQAGLAHQIGLRNPRRRIARQLAGFAVICQK